MTWAEQGGGSIVVASLFIVASIVLLCVGGAGVMVGPCYFVHYLVSSFAIISLEKEESWLLYFNCLLMSFDS